MKKYALSLSLLLLPSLAIAAVPSNGNTTNFLGPTVGLGLIKTIVPGTAFAVQGDFSSKNIRLDGTFGFLIDDDQRFKLSAEYLAQNLVFGYASGDASQWCPQGSLGAMYTYAFGKYMYMYDPSISVQVYASHSPNKSLRTNHGSYQNSAGVTVPYTDVTRIAGSNAAGASPGVYLHPWNGALAGIDLNYDNVRYNDSFPPTNDPKGFGTTVHYTQSLGGNISVNMAAGYRQPFNLYQAGLAWHEVPFFGMWTIGVNGEYTLGKEHLPSTYNLGVHFDYIIDQPTERTYSEREATVIFLEDTANSAARLPQVLATRNELFTKP